MRTIQALDAGAKVSAKWPNHIWSSQAVSDAIKSPEMIKLTSNEDGASVSIHKSLLCFSSSYYAAALNGKFLEANNNNFEICLMGEHLQAFANWIYTGTISTNDESLIISLYLFADEVDILALRRSAISHVADLDVLSWTGVKLILMHVTKNSPIRKYALDSYIAHWKPTTDLSISLPLDPGTTADFLLAHSNFLSELLNGVALRDPSDRYSDECPCCVDLCRYHEHENDEERTATCGQLIWAKLPSRVG
ncbi:hypothetical protein KCU95_g8559, partial [Aureobasidium melanogenum]